MTPLPNPFMNSAPYLPSGSDTAVASVPHCAAAGPLEIPGATNHIGEIFHFARKLVADGIPMDELVERGFNVTEFLTDLEQEPLFLRVAVKDIA
jgi:hypothetical protein